MIGRILYRESVQGVLNYVFGKKGGVILGFQNTISEIKTSPQFFTNVLHFLGQRHATTNRYVHITLNLPHGEHLNDKNFYKLSQDYMNEMGYGDQPYVVVRHKDTIHEHVHIVSTTVMENGGMINLSHAYSRNVATQKYLEKTFGLSPSPETKSHRELPLYRQPELQFEADETNGTKFYLQDVINSLLQRYKVRSFEELAFLVRPYHIVLKTMINENERVGVSFGIDNQKKYKTQFINGYTVHPKLSGPKLNAIFEKNTKSKLLPMHGKRLEKQLETTLKLFKSIRYEDLPDVLKSYQRMDCQLQFGKRQRLLDFTIYDKTGYIFKASEISQQVNFEDHPQLMDNQDGETLIDHEGEQFILEIRKLIKNAFQESYLKSNKSNMLLSEFVMTKNFRDLLPIMAASEPYSFLNHYMDRNNGRTLSKAIQKEFGATRRKLSGTETKREIEGLQAKVALIRKIMDSAMFDSTKNGSIPFYLLRGLGLTYGNGKISYLNSNQHSLPTRLEKIRSSQTNDSYISTGFINQNEKVLEMLVKEEGTKSIELNPTSFFLPMMMSEVYEAMHPEYRAEFERQSLKAYLKTAERLHIRYEKSPADYIRLFNGRGFYFERKNGEIHVSSIYSKYPVSIPLAVNTRAYLNSMKNLDVVLDGQNKPIDNIKDEGRGHLKNLWLSYLIERQLYGKASFMMVYDDVSPNLHHEIMEYHMENGLREKIIARSMHKVSSQQAAFLRKSVYAFSSLLGGSGYKEEEVFNGFKDEMTDYSKYINRFM